MTAPDRPTADDALAQRFEDHRPHLRAVAYRMLGTLAEAEEPEPRADAAKLTKQYMESLGLTGPGLLRLRWKIGPAEQEPVPTEEAAPKKTAPRRKSARDRMTVINGQGA
jgi:hypothetical protein